MRFLAAALSLVVAGSAHAGGRPTQYDLIDLGHAVFPSLESGPGINNKGQVTFGNGTSVVRWENDVITVMPHSNFGIGREINENGDISGYTSDGAARWINDIYQNIGPLLPGVNSQSMSLNNAGHMIAWSLTSDGYRSYYYNGATVTNLGTLGGNTTYAYDINDSDKVVGFSKTNIGGLIHAFSWVNGVLTDLGSPQDSSYAYGINNAGTIVGSWGGGSENPYRYVNGQFITMERLPGTDINSAQAINENGLIVGFSRLTAGGFRALMWQNDKVFDLNTLAGNPAGWNLDKATDVNDAGHIVGVGTHNGELRAFLLKPVPAPSTLGLLVLGLLRRSRKRQ